MALAATKTWSFYSMSQVYGEFTGDDFHAKWTFDLKEFLVSMGWVVRGGYNNLNDLYHNDGSNNDPWPTWEEARKGVSSRDIYVILRSPAALGQEVCFGANFSTSATYQDRLFFYSSQSGYFGASESGSNGTTTSPPTAADQVEWYGENINTVTVPGDITYTFFGAKTSDDKHHRIFCQIGRVISTVLIFGHLENPHANLDNGGRVSSVRMNNVTDSNDSVMNNSFYTSALFQGKVSGANRSLYVGGSGYANVGVQSQFTVRADDKMVVTPMDIYNNTLGEEGYYGTIPDMYWGNNNHFMQLLGDSVGGPANWVSGGSIITPWDPAQPMPRVY